jgi:hypothetical protein
MGWEYDGWFQISKWVKNTRVTRSNPFGMGLERTVKDSVKIL